MSKFNLGDHVAITGTALKVNKFKRLKYKESSPPHRNGFPERKFFTEGYVVGQRTINEGLIDEGVGFKPTEGSSVVVYLVAFDMRMSPAMCFEHQIELKEKP